MSESFCPDKRCPKVSLSSVIADISFFVNVGGRELDSARREIMNSISSAESSESCRTTKRFLNASESLLRPPYYTPFTNPAGFCVANNAKPGDGFKNCPESANCNSLLSSSNLFKASNTSLGHKFNSSNNIQAPFLNALTNGPS